MTRGKQAVSMVIILLAAMSGCIPPPPRPHDASNPLKRVAILPLKNDSNDVDGPDVMRKKMAEALERRSYVIKDLKETDQILRDRMGITLGGQLSLTTAQKLGETLGVEGVLYGTLMDFDESTLGAVNVKKVRGKFKLVNAMNGQTVWERGLGVRSEMRMAGNAGSAATLLARASDAQDKDVPWITIESTTTGSNKLGESFAIGLGTKLLSKAIGKHLDSESAELARRVTDNVPWGPGTGAPETMPPPKIAMPMPEIKAPEPPSFGYMDWEGKRDFSALVTSVTVDKSRNETYTMDMQLAIAGTKVRMDMDMTSMMKGDGQSPFSKVAVIERGDKKIGYTLYHNPKRYTVNKEEEVQDEKPKVEKTKLGSEVIAKHPTEKYKVRITYKDGRIEEGLIWNATDLGGLTIRSEVENKDFKISTELKNIVLKTPAAALFEIPAGYTEAQSVLDLMAAEPTSK